jgi:hypothetical protein
LDYELSLVGCSLRSDSRLCEHYINDNIGDPVEIAGVMQEMKFFYEETCYPSILNKMRKEAEVQYREALDDCYDDDDDFRPQFHEFFCAYEDGETAKDKALEKWAKGREKPYDDEKLPWTLRRSMVWEIAMERFKAWVVSKSWPVNAIVKNTKDLMRSFAWKRNVDVDDHLTPEKFEIEFGVRIRKEVEMIRERSKIDKIVDDAIRAKGCYPDHQPIRTLASSFVKETTSSARFIKGIKDAVGEYMESVTLDTSRNTFVDAVNRMFGRKFEPDRKHVKSINGTWWCEKCNYAGSAQGIWDHSRNRHGVQQIRDIEAILEINNWKNWELNAETFRALIVRALGKDGYPNELEF